MEKEQNIDSKLAGKGFHEHLASLKEVYEKSDLKEKHRLNEHIKHLIRTYGNPDTRSIEDEMK